MLEVRPQLAKITMILSDFGHPFEPIETDAPDVNALLEDQPTSGFGLFFIYRTMDDVSYYTDEDGNHLVLVKELKRK
jgi:anti-sigma regulatory factor (Ser/Thr protein kinase)